MPTRRIAAGSHGQNQHGWLIPGHDRQLVHIFRENMSANLNIFRLDAILAMKLLQPPEGAMRTTWADW